MREGERHKVPSDYNKELANAEEHNWQGNTAVRKLFLRQTMLKEI